MKGISLLYLIICFSTAYSQEPVTTIYLLRHAEKADSTPDTPLSEAGNQRALKWADYFKDIPVEAIYTTNYQRTKQTVAPLATAKGLSPQFYKPEDALADVIAANKGKTIVIAGHSNTIPAAINKVIGKEIYTDIAEDEFNNLYKITISGNTITHILTKV
jgi:broad specificity phosphatase PhoE